MVLFKQCPNINQAENITEYAKIIIILSLYQHILIIHMFTTLPDVIFIIGLEQWFVLLPHRNSNNIYNEDIDYRNQPFLCYYAMLFNLERIIFHDVHIKI